MGSMPTPEQDLIDAVTADDAARVKELLAADPALGSARDRDGVSALMLSRYRFDRATTDALLALDPDLDVFEATALGYLDRLRERLEEDPSRATAFSPDGFTALHLAAFFGKAEVARALLEVGAVALLVAIALGLTRRLAARASRARSRSSASPGGSTPG